MNDDLAPLPAAEPLEKRFMPNIQSAANPAADWLLEARAVLNSNKELRERVHEARSAGTSAVTEMARAFDAAWGGNRWDNAREAAEYLWDEQEQLGDGAYLVDTRTGRVALAVREEDIYQPAPVPREGGGMATPLPRIRPDLEAAVTCWFHDREREERVVAALVARARQTDLLREDGDPRLLVATRAGRRHIVNQLSTFDPKVLLRAAGGTSGTFLTHFELTTNEDSADLEGLTLIEGEAFSRSVMGVQDQTTVNLRHNRAASLQGALVQGWIREIARRLGNAAHSRVKPREVHVRDLAKADLAAATFWVCPPEDLRYLKKADLSLALMPIASANLTGLQAAAGVLVVPAEFSATSREMFDRWEAHSSVKFRLWIDWTKVVTLRLLGIEHQAVPTNQPVRPPAKLPDPVIPETQGGYFSFIVVAPEPLAIDKPAVLLDQGRNVFTAQVDDLSDFLEHLKIRGIKLLDVRWLNNFSPLPADSLLLPDERVVVLAPHADEDS